MPMSFLDGRRDLSCGEHVPFSGRSGSLSDALRLLLLGLKRPSLARRLGVVSGLGGGAGLGASGLALGLRQQGEYALLSVRSRAFV